MEYNITLFTVFVAGVVSFLSPCILPVLPAYIAILAGTDTQDLGAQHWAFLVKALSFLSGFALLFTVMGAAASYIGELFVNYQELIRKVGAVFMVIMGLQILGLIKIPGVKYQYTPALNNICAKPLGAFLLGLALSVSWIPCPCTGSIFAAVLVYAGTTATFSQGALLLLTYAMGACLPFFLTAMLFNSYLNKFKSIYKWLPVIQQAAGVILIVTGIVIYFDFGTILDLGILA